MEGRAQLKPEMEIENSLGAVCFCDLIQNPEVFAGEKVSLRAIFRLGSEWSELYCLSCKGRMWLEYGDSFEALTRSKILKKIKWSERGKTLNVNAVGKLYTSGGYGHLGGYKYKFVAEYFEEAEVILKESPGTIPINIHRKTKC
jgi:hypothetical protein